MKTYQVTYKAWVDVFLDVRAETAREAISKAKEDYLGLTPDVDHVQEYAPVDSRPTRFRAKLIR